MSPVRYSAQTPRKPGWYWTLVRDDTRQVVCVRQISKHPEHGLVIHTDPVAPEMSMKLSAWTSNTKAWFAGPLPPPPEV